MNTAGREENSNPAASRGEKDGLPGVTMPQGGHRDCCTDVGHLGLFCAHPVSTRQVGHRQGDL